MFAKTVLALTAAIAFTAAAAVPAMSATAKARTVTHTSSFAQVMPMRHSTNPGNDVYVNGRYVGSDPDRFIRQQLRNDPPWIRN
jgi:hypothetical protein